MAFPAAFLHHSSRFDRDNLRTGKQDARIQVTLQSDSLAYARPCRFQIYPPIDAENVSAAGSHVLQEIPGTIDEENGRSSRPIYSGEDLLFIGQPKLSILSLGKLSCPGVK